MQAGIKLNKYSGSINHAWFPWFPWEHNESIRGMLQFTFLGIRRGLLICVVVVDVVHIADVVDVVVDITDDVVVDVVVVDVDVDITDDVVVDVVVVDVDVDITDDVVVDVVDVDVDIIDDVAQLTIAILFSDKLLIFIELKLFK